MPTMGSHQSAAPKTDVWLTPPHILKALGEFDLDPCCPAVMPWPTAKRHLTKADDGLTAEWHGRVWCNPPYSTEAVKWLRRMLENGNGIALTFARTGADWFFETVWSAHGLFFLQNYLYFHHADGKRAAFNAGAPSVLVAYSAVDTDILSRCGLKGKFVRLK